MIETIIVFIVILAFLVLVHELGHFLVAKKSGIAVEEFGLGFPPKLISKKYGDTNYSLNAIPLGGFVKIKGGDGENEQEEDSFGAKPIWKRVAVICAGVTMNILAGWLLLTILFMAGAPVEVTDDIPVRYIHNKHISVNEVLLDSPAEAAGLLAGDTLVSAGGNEYTDIESFQNFVSSQTKPTEIVYQRSEIQESSFILPKSIEGVEDGRPIIGVGLSEIGTVKFPPHKAVIAGAQSTWNYIDRIASAFGGIFARLFHGKGVGESLGGPVAIAVATNDVLDLGLAHVIIFTAVLSFNLAIINILPFPALDGGRLIFLIAEKIRGKPSRQEVEAWFHRIGFILLMVLAVVITYRDIVHFGGRIWQAVVG